ncbi:PKD domain-containing protein [Methylomonas methanica]|uniref:PKD domain containing protein n=1 Tax=Methylomonas methanica (strain DSM 25384 / MC09) TaxID=857087 RepID=G0A1A0_METMM|nr:PKD domain-containing protein [Methylomonas methanica]AEG02520.1 PKD domain containing protein [Methylomonas methanica MC09]
MRYFIRVMIILFLLTFSGFFVNAMAAESLQIAPDYILISSKRITRVEFEYTYKAQVTNRGTAEVSSAEGVVSSLSANTVVTDEKISFGLIPAGATVTSSDTFTFRHNRTFPFDPSSLVWKLTTTSNQAPLASAGNDLNVLVQIPTELDGRDSYDPDGNLVSYRWELVKAPVGSNAILVGGHLPNPTFIADIPGEYTLSLITNDGKVDSQVDQVIIKAAQGIALPNADAGKDINALLGSTVTLDGNNSSDPNGIFLDYLWSFSQAPSSSQLTNNDLISANTATSQFTPDVEGVFDLGLKVDNGTGADSDAVRVIVSQSDVAPNVDAGHSFAAQGDIALDGSNSNDPDNGPSALSFAWDFVAVPQGSLLQTAQLENRLTATPHFTPDREGAYVLRLTVSDGEKNGSDNILVISDKTPPNLQFISPKDAATVTTSTPTFSITFDDSGSKVDKKTFRLTINGVDVTANTTVSDSGATYKVLSALPAGANQATATISDNAGNEKSVTVRFTVSVFRAIASCSPTEGQAPLSVKYQSKSEFTGGSIVRYRWDFDGNGTYDTSDSVATDYTRNWTNVGVIRSTLEVTNNLGQTATDSCAINVGGNAPTAVANASPSNGPAPLNVNLTCTGSDKDGTISKYEWDFDGDGVFDYSSASSGSVSHTYSTIGELIASCRVTDNSGLTGLARTTTTVIRPSLPGSPSVTATVSPAVGNGPLRVNFSGTAVDDGSIKLWEWDFNGDGVYEYSSATTATTSFIYVQAGVFAPKLRATDNDGNVGIDTAEVVVNLSATLSIASETFEPGLGQTATISTTLSAGVPVKLVVKNQNGQIVRTVVQTNRAAGSFSDSWDGRNDAGSLVPEGVYYAVLEYDFSGETRSVDLTNTTGGSRYNPSRTSIPSKFSPFAGQPLVIDFTLTRASEVTAFIGRFNVDTRLITFYDRLPFPKGTHRIVWNGENAEGQLIHPPTGDSFLFGIWGYNLPNNALFVKNSAQISGLSALPSILVPSDHVDSNGNLAQSDISFTLSNTADAELIVFDATTGKAVASRYFRQLAAGSNTAHWDGRDDNGTFVAPGRYRLGMAAIDSGGQRSIRLYTLQRVYY